MRKLALIVLVLIYNSSTWAQVGIGTITPQGALDVTSTNMAFIAPRDTSLGGVTNGN